MLKKIVAAAMLAAAVLATAPSHAVTESARYVAGAYTIVGVPGSSVTGERIGIGGWTFVGKSTAPKSLKLVDAAAPATKSEGIGVIICAGTCQEYQKGFCTNSSGVVNLGTSGIPAGKVLRVGVSTVEPGGIWVGVDACDGVATTGTLTVTW